MLEGKTVNLRIVEKEDLPLVGEWLDYFGEYNPLVQMSRTDLQKMYDNNSRDEGWFFIEKKDCSEIGNISHTPKGRARLC